jgi:TetR/AcrR family transcriptional repressor of nem operon
MARPREFDEDVVLEQVLSVFWTKGFDGTSIDDLVSVTGLGRASLYGAFGDKEKLFERALALYVSRAATLLPEIVDGEPVPVALRALLHRWVSRSCPKEGPKGCFLQVAGTVGEATPVAQEAFRRSLAQMERGLTKLLALGQSRGEIRNDREAPALARLLVIVSQGIASSARAGWGTDRLSSVVDEVLADVAPPPRG